MTTSSSKSTKPVYRMSSAGACPKKLGWQRLGKIGTEAPAWLDTAAEEGNWHEQRIKNEMRAADWQVYDEQREIVLEYPTFLLVGHIDGICEDRESNHYLLEVKSMSQFEFDRWMKGKFEVFPAYAAQVTLYMAGTELDKGRYVVKNRSSGYKDEFIIEEPPTSLESIVNTITEVEKLALSGQVMDMEYDPSSVECRRCEFNNVCMPAEVVREERDLIDAARLWREAKALEVEVNSKLALAESVLKGHLRAHSEEGTKPYRYMVSGLSVAGYVTKEKEVSYLRKAGYQCRVTDTEKERE